MVPVTLATDMDGCRDFKSVSTPGSLNWKHGIGRASHAGLRRTRVDECVHPRCMRTEQVASESYTYHPQTNAQHGPERSSRGQRLGHPPFNSHVMPAPSKARDFISQGGMHPISIDVWRVCQFLHTRTPREGIGRHGLCSVLSLTH